MSTPDVSLGSWLARRAERTPHRDALLFEGDTWTYGRLQREVDSVARQLGELGVRRGDRVAFLGLNQPGFLVVLFAASRVGAVFVPLNFRLTGPEVEFQVHDCGARLVVADEMHRPLVESIDLAGAAVLAVDQLDTTGEPLAEPAELTADDVAVIMYTSGTTGRPKGAMLTHGNFWWNNLNALFNLDILADDRTLVIAPLFHIGGLNVTTLLTLQKGGLVVLHRAFDPAAALAALSEHRITTMFGVPAMFQFIAQHPTFADTDLSSLRLMICGGAPCPEPLLKLWDQRGVPMQQGYGLTETAPMVTFLPPEYSLGKLGSSGITPLFCDVKLVDADGATVSEPDARGEVCVRGPNVTPGYWDRPDATAAAIDADGWFHTGDIAYLDADGFLYIADRVKDMIISGGENIYPAEVESVLFDHPAIADIAVIGSPDDKWGETVTAVAVLTPDATLTIEDLREWAGERLARYKLPRRLEVVEALPRGGSGKILKFELRESFG